MAGEVYAAEEYLAGNFAECEKQQV